eukprot:TRINITY_DN5552_c0_g2_i8.p3 TRINITY_DN5552_c0_g2~~TRINITY_DN5552_c0_g2_i8.p3  ORF type:complete len:163 (+),score=55.63 TRINITY_DN5552_c0_g2_i8:742-1230(+)
MRLEDGISRIKSVLVNRTIVQEDEKNEWRNYRPVDEDLDVVYSYKVDKPLKRYEVDISLQTVSYGKEKVVERVAERVPEKFVEEHDTEVVKKSGEGEIDKEREMERAKERKERERQRELKWEKRKTEMETERQRRHRERRERQGERKHEIHETGKYEKVVVE